MADSAALPPRDTPDAATGAGWATPLPHHACPLCGGPNGCGPAALGRFDVPCWCREATVSPEALARVPPPERGQSCLCARCATSAVTTSQETAP